jgi:hypothetical protein
MPCTPHIYDEKICSTPFPYSLYMACTAYIYMMKKVGPVTPPTACTAYIYIYMYVYI